MNNYIPTEVKDLTESKQRVMQNVVTEIQKTSRRPKHTWRYLVISVVLIMSTMLFVLNEIYIENDHQTATEPALDLTQPTFSEEQGLFYLHGVTLGDSQSRVIELLGENYIKEDYEENTVADLILDYNGNARFYFHENKVVKILLMEVDKYYFGQLFKDYAGFKFITLASEDDTDRFFYSKETGQLLKATTAVPNENLYLYLIPGGKDLLENPDFPKWEAITNNDSLKDEGSESDEEVIKDDVTKEEIRFVEEINDSFVITYGIENMDRGNHDFTNDHQIVIKKTNDIQGGDIIYFKYPEDDGLPNYNPDSYLARVVGLPGETVEIRDGQVYINNQKLESFYGESRRLGINKEEWFKANTTYPLKEADFEVNMKSIKVTETAVFVLSDDWFRSTSSIDFGPIEVSEIKGKVLGYLKE